MSTRKKEVPFLYYVNDGECKSNAEMPPSPEAFWGWFSAASVIRNQGRHAEKDVSAAMKSLRKFVARLKEGEQIKEKDLLSFL